MFGLPELLVVLLIFLITSCCQAEGDKETDGEQACYMDGNILYGILYIRRQVYACIHAS